MLYNSDEIYTHYENENDNENDNEEFIKNKECVKNEELLNAISYLCQVVDDSPSNSLYIRKGKYYYGDSLNKILKNKYNITFIVCKQIDTGHDQYIRYILTGNSY